jgi:hypothetical protein
MRRRRNKWPPNCLTRSVRARASREAPLRENEVRERMSDRSTADEHPAAPGGNTPIEKLIDDRIFQT